MGLLQGMGLQAGRPPHGRILSHLIWPPLPSPCVSLHRMPIGIVMSIMVCLGIPFATFLPVFLNRKTLTTAKTQVISLDQGRSSDESLLTPHIPLRRVTSL
jgi:hypothetical protein